jgi:UDP:flavonoid glycosyltransferase YjiC (YdhE family)
MKCRRSGKSQITILGISSRGDVQPLVAHGAGLQHNGHQVHVVAGDEFDSFIRHAGLEFISLGVNIQAAMQAHTDLFRFMACIKNRKLKASEMEQDAIVATF